MPSCPQHDILRSQIVGGSARPRERRQSLGDLLDQFDDSITGRGLFVTRVGQFVGQRLPGEIVDDGVGENSLR